MGPSGIRFGRGLSPGPRGGTMSDFMSYASPSSSLSARGDAFWRAIPFKGVIAVAVFLQLAGEQYPFSNFPMYASLAPETNYIYVADGAGRVVPILPTFGLMGSEIKKMIYSEEKTLKRAKIQKGDRGEAAARQVLDYLLSRVDKRRRAALLAAGLSICRVSVARKESGFVNTKEILAERAPAQSAPPPL